MKLTTQKQVRIAFWESLTGHGRKPSHYRGMKTQNDFPVDVRMAYVDYVDSLQKSGIISEKLAERVTL